MSPTAWIPLGLLLLGVMGRPSLFMWRLEPRSGPVNSSVQEFWALRRNLSGPGRVCREEPQGGLTTMGTFLAWLLLFILCWPVAVAALILYPFLWLLAL